MMSKMVKQMLPNGAILISCILQSAVFVTTVLAQDNVTSQDDTIDVAGAIAAAEADKAKDREGVTRAAGLNPDELAATKIPVISIGTNNPTVRAYPFGFRSQGTSYVLNSNADGSTLSLTGKARSTIVPDDGTIAKNVPDEGNEPCYFVRLGAENGDDPENENAADCSWTRFGVSYNLRLTCRSQDDIRCKDKEFLQSVALEQIVVKGGP
jgi:hypothetical protein